MSLLTDFLKDNTDVRTTYVKVGTAVVNALAAPLEMLLAHLLQVQGIDPKQATPNQFLKEALVAALNQVDDPEELDPDFDVDWVVKHYAKAKDRLNNLTRESYRKMTDLTHVSDNEVERKSKAKEIADKIMAKTEAKETPLYTVKDQEKIQELAKHGKEVFRPSGELNTDSLKEALETLAKYADKLQLEDDSEKPTVSVPRQVTAVGRSRKAKKKSSAKMYSDVHSEESKVARHRVTKTFGGNFKRVSED